MKAMNALLAAAAAITLAGLAAAGPAGAAVAGAAPAGGGTGTKAVTYHGLVLHVPAGWPVYRLAQDPTRCILLDRHAVYLGQPGPEQDCPARAIGARTEALWVRPLGAATAATLPPGVVALRKRPAAVGLPPNADRTWQVALPAYGVLVTASYGEHPAMVRGLIAGQPLGAKVAGTGTPPATQQSRASDESSTPGAQSSPRSVVSGQVVQARGFDACTAPSVATMGAWLDSPYRVAGTYLGGVNWACTYGNFTRSWVQQVSHLGWRFIPIYVGRQSACSGIPGAVYIKPSQAGSEGEAAAGDAVSLARYFGYGPTSPIYFDMEGYNSSNTTCRRAVLSFLNAWTRGLHRRGYQSGVYSSAASGIANLASVYHASGYARPDDIWIADWTGDPVLSDPYVPNSDWAHHQRLHQFYGGHNETWGGALVNVDDDVIDGAVAGEPGTIAHPGYVVATPSAAPVPPGGSTTLMLSAGDSGDNPRGATRWQAQAPSGLAVTPSRGVLAPSGPRSSQTVRISAGSNLPPGRYDIAFTASTGRAPATETFVLASVTPLGASLVDTIPLRLYAASPADMAVAEQVAHQLALPKTDLVGQFSLAWTDLESGRYLLLAVGAAADNALFENPCGWANPSHDPAGTTPFFYAGSPQQSPPGADVYENSAGSTRSGTARLTSTLAQYAFTGELTNDGPIRSGPTSPSDVCLGQADVPLK